MLDIRLIREDPDRVKRAMKTRNKDMDAVVDEIIAIDQKRRELASKRDALKAEQNSASKLIPQIKKSGGDISEIMQKMNKVKEA
ncbi:MAG: serine--tRNA ligase, partial [Clostridia bacterium]|nr:serine--tRNA ligase [Clostridia bacterium]